MNNLTISVAIQCQLEYQNKLFMYSWVSSLKIRQMESGLYRGPETVEHAFERDDDFQATHIRRRDQTDAPRSTPKSTAVWYRMVYDSETREMTFVTGPNAPK
jgi:hypothetical protein